MILNNNLRLNQNIYKLIVRYLFRMEDKNMTDKNKKVLDEAKEYPIFRATIFKEGIAFNFDFNSDNEMNDMYNAINSYMVKNIRVEIRDSLSHEAIMLRPNGILKKEKIIISSIETPKYIKFKDLLWKVVHDSY